MKRYVCILLTACLLCLCVGASAATEFTARDARDAKLKALDCLMVCGFASEYNNGSRNYMVRWEEPISIAVIGRPTERDLLRLDEFLLELSIRVPMLPNITRVQDESRAQITIAYVPLKQLADYVPGYVEGNWGMFTYWESGARITRASIGIATDVTDQKERNHLMKEELVGALGLCSDHELYSDSILYQKWTTVQELSNVDWLMLNMLYDPDVSCGMTGDAVYAVQYTKIMQN